MGLGLVPVEQGKEPVPDLSLARQNIDLLELMAEKTNGNRTSDEDELLNKLLFETRMAYVEISKKLEGNDNGNG